MYWSALAVARCRPQVVVAVEKAVEKVAVETLDLHKKALSLQLN